ncbi:DMT family transporter [Carboxylicivirga mesophila]|uniref:DMT family transporter n=1 Tax=Carboxylicivirga mesophila TaxID=1166478 RepID=A0ABS5KF46_9BACT|nr:DMT family transporter [Carboxylicivirga mesophila]MBS2213675.1 DMT family transporter [Carboxylicivirga mesophila]
MYLKYILTGIALLIGGLLAVQGSINSQLGGLLKNPLQAAFVNFFVGTIILLAINVFAKTDLPAKETIKAIPLYLFIGGVMGAVYVSSAIILIPKIGVATMLGASIGGQMIVASIIDHYGFFNITVHAISPGRIAGIILLIIGVFLIQRF